MKKSSRLSNKRSAYLQHIDADITALGMMLRKAVMGNQLTFRPQKLQMIDLVKTRAA